MSKKNDISQNDQDLFRKTIKNLSKLTAKEKKLNLSSATTHAPLSIDISLSDHIDVPVAPEEALSFKRSGISQDRMKKLKAGKFKLEATLDLHLMTVDDARDEILNFISSCSLQNLRTVLIIHGKGHRQANQYPILKNHVNTWLRQMPNVLAFCSAAPKHGGTGAVYLLLKMINTKSI